MSAKTDLVIIPNLTEVVADEVAEAKRLAAVLDAREARRRRRRVGGHLGEKSAELARRRAKTKAGAASRSRNRR